MNVVLILGVVAASIVFIFTWVYEELGPLFFVLALFCLIIGGVYIRRTFLVRRYVALQALVLKTVGYPVVTKKAQQVNAWLIGKHPGWFPLIRNLQVIRESLDIALNSKKRDVAESRMELALIRWQETQRTYGGLLAPETTSIVRSVVEEAQLLYHTTKYLNVAETHLEKAQSLKTEKGRAKHRGLARSIIRNGLNDPLSDKEKLAEVLTRLELNKMSGSEMP